MRLEKKGNVIGKCPSQINNYDRLISHKKTFISFKIFSCIYPYKLQYFAPQNFLCYNNPKSSVTPNYRNEKKQVFTSDQHVRHILCSVVLVFYS